MEVREDKMRDFEELSLELTDCCPLNCLHCSSNSSSQCNNYLPTELIKTLIDDAAKMNVSKVSLGGGEPTIAQNFLPTLKYISNKGVPVEVFTSGATNLNGELERYPDALIESLSKIENLKMIFSIYGAKQETHDTVTQTPGSFEAVQISLQKCLGANIKCEVNYVPLKLNVKEFDQLIDLIESYSLNKVSILRFVPQGRGLDNKDIIEMSLEEEDAFIAEILDLREVRDFEIRTGSPFNGIISDNNVPCRAGFAKLVVQANGNVLPCEVFKHHDRRNWNLSIYDHSLREILSSEQITTLRKQLKKYDCLKCPIHFGLRKKLEKETLSV